MIYLDNAATTHYKPRQVIETALKYMTNSYNFNRSGHTGATQTATQVALVREKVCDFVGATNPNNVVFCHNCTHALNIALLGRVRRGGHVITSVNEHNSILRPLYELEKRKLIEVTYITPAFSGITVDDIKSEIRANTYMVALQHVSNVTGETNDIFTIGRELKKYSIDFLVDGAQSVGYLPINMKECGVSLLCFPSHKGLHSIQGSGVLVFEEGFEPQPILFGGTGSDSANLSQPNFSPDKYEVGTSNGAALISLGSAIDWFNATKHVKLPNIAYLQMVLQDALSDMEGVKTYSVPNGSGIVSFAIDGMDSGEVGDILNSEYGIATRSGLHCAPLIHKRLGTFKSGLVRASLSGENTKSDCYALISAVAQIVKSRK